MFNIKEDVSYSEVITSRREQLRARGGTSAAFGHQDVEEKLLHLVDRLHRGRGCIGGGVA